MEALESGEPDFFNIKSMTINIFNSEVNLELYVEPIFTEHSTSNPKLIQIQRAANKWINNYEKLKATAKHCKELMSGIQPLYATLQNIEVTTEDEDAKQELIGCIKERLDTLTSGLGNTAGMTYDELVDAMVEKTKAQSSPYVNVVDDGSVEAYLKKYYETFRHYSWDQFQRMGYYRVCKRRSRGYDDTEKFIEIENLYNKIFYNQPYVDYPGEATMEEILSRPIPTQKVAV